MQLLDESLSDARDFTNTVVNILDNLDSLEADILIGRISAMDIIRDSFDGVEEAENIIRELDSQLNSLGDNSAELEQTTARLQSVELSSISGDEMASLFNSTAATANDLEAFVLALKETISEARDLVGGFANALYEASGTPIIGDALGEFAVSVSDYASELSSLTDALGTIETDLSVLQERMENGQTSAGKILAADIERWMAEPYDSEWPPTDTNRSPAGTAQPSAAESRDEIRQAAEIQAATAIPTPVYHPFALDWWTSSNVAKAGESFTLTVEMNDVQQAGEHGGISVSFPSLTESGGSKRKYSSRIADVEVIEYTSGVVNVAFYQPGVTIWDDDNKQIPAKYLLVESDNSSWSRSDDRTLVLRITPKREGEFPMQIRGWLCLDGYTDCYRQPYNSGIPDQQWYNAEIMTVEVTR